MLLVKGGHVKIRLAGGNCLSLCCKWIVVAACAQACVHGRGSTAFANGLPTRYAFHLGDLERLATFYGVLQLGFANRVGELIYDDDDVLMAHNKFGRVDRFEGSFVGLVQAGLCNKIHHPL